MVKASFPSKSFIKDQRLLQQHATQITMSLDTANINGERPLSSAPLMSQPARKCIRTESNAPLAKIIEMQESWLATNIIH
jgi:hypothetical protein